MPEPENNGKQPLPENTAQLVLTMNRATCEFSITGTVLTFYEALGMLDVAMRDLRAKVLEQRAANAPRVVPASVVPMRRQ